MSRFRLSIRFPDWRLGSALMLAYVLFASTALATATPATRALAAQEPASPTWTQTALTEPVSNLFTPASGALFARTASGLHRSDDAGLSWREVSLPATPLAARTSIVVDPTNHTTIYLMAADGIYKTVDDAASWSIILPAASLPAEQPSTRNVEVMAVSPADPRILYVMHSSPTGNDLRFQRSPDGGRTWEMLPNAGALPPGTIPQKCYWSIPLLQPHQTDPSRLFRAAACNIRGNEVPLKESRDGGQTLTDVIYKHPLSQVTRLVGGQSDAPQRLFLGVNKDPHGGGSLLVRSDDDGASWRTLLEYRGGGGMTGGGPNVTIAGLALDPSSSERLLVGLNASRGTWELPPSLRLSLDAGTTWHDAAPEGIGRMSDVAFGVDGRMLFAASETGIWRATMP